MDDAMGGDPPSRGWIEPEPPRVDFSAVAGPVLVIVGGCDRLVHRRLPPLAQPTVGADGAADGPISPPAGKRQ